MLGLTPRLANIRRQPLGFFLDVGVRSRVARLQVDFVDQVAHISEFR